MAPLRACPEWSTIIHARALLQKVVEKTTADDKIAYIWDILRREDVLWEQSDFDALIRQLRTLSRNVSDTDDQMSFRILCERVYKNTKFWKFIIEQVSDIVSDFSQRFSNICSRLWGVDGRPYRA